MNTPKGNRLKGLIVTSSIDPISHFNEIFEHERKGNLRRCNSRSRIEPLFTVVEPLPALLPTAHRQQPWARPGIQLWRNWLNYDPNHWMKTLSSKSKPAHRLQESSMSSRHAGVIVLRYRCMS
jgi:hypothetical protein